MVKILNYLYYKLVKEGATSHRIINWQSFFLSSFRNSSATAFSKFVASQCRSSQFWNRIVFFAIGLFYVDVHEFDSQGAAVDKFQLIGQISHVQLFSRQTFIMGNTIQLRLQFRNTIILS